MREIKFRALTREGKIIKNVGKIEFFEDGTIIVNDEIPVEKLIQYTSLKDKNRKEIYEGDLMTFPPTYHEYEGIFIIRWNPKEVWFSPINAKDKGYDESNNIYVSPDPREWKEGKIIGNIYENPELVEIEKAKPNKKIN